MQKLHQLAIVIFSQIEITPTTLTFRLAVFVYNGYDWLQWLPCCDLWSLITMFGSRKQRKVAKTNYDSRFWTLLKIISLYNIVSNSCSAFTLVQHHLLTRETLLPRVLLSYVLALNSVRFFRYTVNIINYT